MKYAVRLLSILFGAALIINGICLLLFANFTVGTLLTLLSGAVLFLPSVFSNQAIRLMRYKFFKVLSVLTAFVGVCFLTCALFLYFYGHSENVTYNEDYLLILGCGLRGSEPTSPLKARLDTALDYLEKNDSCTVIVSGGRGNGEDISEAEAMRRYLTEHGIEDERILIEDKSTSTTENFKFSNKIINGALASEPAAFITNDFHIYRATSLAKLQGFSLTHKSAPTSWYNIAPCYLRENLAMMQMQLFNK